MSRKWNQCTKCENIHRWHLHTYRPLPFHFYYFLPSMQMWIETAIFISLFRFANNDKLRQEDNLKNKTFFVWCVLLLLFLCKFSNKPFLITILFCELTDGNGSVHCTRPLKIMTHMQIISRWSTDKMNHQKTGHNNHHWYRIRRNLNKLFEQEKFNICYKAYSFYYRITEA